MTRKGASNTILKVLRTHDCAIELLYEVNTSREKFCSPTVQMEFSERKFRLLFLRGAHGRWVTMHVLGMVSTELGQLCVAKMHIAKCCAHISVRHRQYFALQNKVTRTNGLQFV